MLNNSSSYTECSSCFTYSDTSVNVQHSSLAFLPEFDAWDLLALCDGCLDFLTWDFLFQTEVTLRTKLTLFLKDLTAPAECDFLYFNMKSKEILFHKQNWRTMQSCPRSDSPKVYVYFSNTFQRINTSTEWIFYNTLKSSHTEYCCFITNLKCFYLCL